MKYFLIIMGFMFLASCQKHKTKAEVAQQKIETLAKKKYQEKYVVKLNESKDYALVLKKRKINNNPFPTVSFSIYEVSTQKLLHEDTVPGGRIKWQSNNVIEVSSMVGRPRDMHGNKKKPLYLYNVKTTKKMKK